MPGRTITIHLTRPDAEFLHKLTLQFADVVPATTDRRPTGDRAPPGTGPYRVAAWDTKHGGYLVRNPHFRSSSPRARPAGFADRIEVHVVPPGATRAQVRAVQNGTADLVVLANPFVALFPPERLGALAVRSPGRLYSRPEAVINYMFLNVHRPPFDDVNVRRAVNYATDRARVVELEGGPDVAARPGPGRGWTAPDIERARALVAASGTAGQRVVVVVPDFKRALGRYFTRLLDKLRYRASVRILGDNYFPVIFDPRTHAQIGFGGFNADYLAPSSFIQANFTCASQASRPVLNVSYFCDRRAGSAGRPTPRRPGRRGGPALGRDRSPADRPRARRPADQPTLRAARLKARRQRSTPSPGVHPARSDVGPLTEPPPQPRRPLHATSPPLLLDPAAASQRPRRSCDGSAPRRTRMGCFSRRRAVRRPDVVG
jgi:hypothetical protein